MENNPKANTSSKGLPVQDVPGDIIVPGVKRKGLLLHRLNCFFKSIRTVIPPYIFFLATLYAIQILCFQAFRLIFFFSNYDKIEPASLKYLKLVWYYGFRFDTIVSCLILLIPFIILTIDYFFEWNKRWIYKVNKIYLRTLLFISFLICSADIPFFAFFNSRLTTSAFLWKDNLWDMVGFILGDQSKYPYLVILMLSSAAFILLLVRLQGRLFNENLTRFYHPASHKIILSLSASALLLIGIRGGLSTNPLSIRNLTHSNHYFINQLSWNPIISLYDSFDAFTLDYLDQRKALEISKKLLGGEEGYASPIARKVSFNEPPLQANVVLVLMESMSAAKMGLFGNRSNLTPNLDTLAGKGMDFTNMYTAGIHTCNGVYGTLFSMPSLMAVHPMNNLSSMHQHFTGLYQTLSNNNYQSAFICTNDADFDNMGYFVRNNGCQYVYDIKDFPPGSIVNSWGPADETLFGFSIAKLNRLYENKNPFFATLVTISTHEPYTIPSESSFRHDGKNKTDRAYKYADWCIGRFMDSCSVQPWFNNTIFVFIADHGINSPGPYEIPLSFHHSPLIIYAPGIIREPRKIQCMSMQADVFPTLMGILRIPYVNNTFGIDLLREKRPYAYFSHDHMLGVIDENYFLVVSKSGSRSLYQYRNQEAKNYLPEKKALADSMQTYTMSMFQTAQWMLINKKAGQQYKLFSDNDGNFSR